MKRFLLFALLTIALCLSTMAADVTTPDGISYDLNGTEATVVAGDYSTLEVAIIPDAIHVNDADYTVTAIASDAFNLCMSLRHVSIPATVTSIGANAFSGCSLMSLSLYASINYADAFISCWVQDLYVAKGVTELKGLSVNPTNIYCFSDEPPVCDNATFVTYDAVLHVTVKAMTDFFLDEFWSKFNNINSDAGEQPETLTLSDDELTLTLGDTYQLNAEVNTGCKVPILWLSTNPQVVAIENGQLTAKSAGEAEIIVSCMGEREDCHVMVQNPLITASLDKHILMLKRGEIDYLTANTSPIETNVTWSSTNTDVAVVRMVDGKAMVLGNRPGDALIVATPESEPNQPDTCMVTVIRPDGDVNCDGITDVSDVDQIIDFVLGKRDSEINDFTDLNGDGMIDVTDVDMLIDIVLGKIKLETKTFIVNGVSFKMIFVEGGTFYMGATIEQGNDANDDEKPVHEVALSGYCIGETEVTQELWQAVMGNNPSFFTPANSYELNLQRPVERVSWDDCQAFIAKLNELTGQQFRLPTEAEWEFAARGGNLSRGYKYAGSNTLGDVVWYSQNGDWMTHQVATKSPNELGLYDMSGNVWEWCQDWYGNYSSSAQPNPIGPSSGYSRVNRGGGFASDASKCRVSHRSSDSLDFNSRNLGLRLAL